MRCGIVKLNRPSGPYSSNLVGIEEGLYFWLKVDLEHLSNWELNSSSVNAVHNIQLQIFIL